MSDWRVVAQLPATNVGVSHGWCGQIMRPLLIFVRKCVLACLPACARALTRVCTCTCARGVVRVGGFAYAAACSCPCLCSCLPLCACPYVRGTAKPAEHHHINNSRMHSHILADAGEKCDSESAAEVGQNLILKALALRRIQNT